MGAMHQSMEPMSQTALAQRTQGLPRTVEVRLAAPQHSFYLYLLRMRDVLLCVRSCWLRRAGPCNTKGRCGAARSGPPGGKLAESVRSVRVRCPSLKPGAAHGRPLVGPPGDGHWLDALQAALIGALHEVELLQKQRQQHRGSRCTL